ncbi:MAG: DUF3365 domain-containing protein [Acidobacteria bacterium]|jgi:hypothetical protein|nr:DUF3365 domain-containing protein [Acidobacteriota bacterium]
MATAKRVMLAGGVLGALALAWAVAEVADPVPQADLERARQAAGQLKGELMKSLTAALAEGGPSQGVRVCSEIAPGIAARLSRDGMTVHRVTTRPRNPANAPDAWERELLDGLAAAHARGEDVVELVETSEEKLPRGAAGSPKRVLLYMAPLTVAAPCLQCHGDPAQIDPAVKAALAEKYPKDQATGYKAGDFRGAVAVRIERP